MRIELDEEALRRANPSRATKVAIPTADEGRAALRTLKVPSVGAWWMDRDAPEIAKAVRATIHDGDSVKDEDAAAGVLALLDPYEEDHEPCIAPVVAYLASSLGAVGLLRALMASNQIGARTRTTHYDYMKREVWLAAARVLCAADDDDYRAARDIAAKARAELGKDKGLCAALAMIFSSEPWATADAKAFRTSPIGGDGDRATCLLLACDDWATSERLMKQMLAKGSLTPSGPVYALLHRFGERAEPLALAAYDMSLAQRDAVATAWISGALTCISSPAVAALFEKRIGKKVGGAEAEAYFRRWPRLETIAPKKKKKTTTTAKSEARFAVLGGFDMYAWKGDGSTKAWRRCMTNPAAFDDWPTKLGRTVPQLVGDALDRWTKRLEIRGDFPVEIRGVSSQSEIEAHGVELLSLFRLGEAAPIYFNGELIVFSFDLGWGVRLELYERGESELTVIDEAPDMHEELARLVEP
jgi:hypothetical protein